MHRANSSILTVRSLEDEDPPGAPDVEAAVVGLDRPELDGTDDDEPDEPVFEETGGREAAGRDPLLHAVNAKANATIRAAACPPLRHPRRQAVGSWRVLGSESLVRKSLAFHP